MGDVAVPSWLALPLVVVTGFLLRAIPHLFLVDRWIIEEAYNYVTVRDLVLSGTSTQAGFYPMLEHQLIYAVWLVTRIDPVVLSQYANPLLGALTAIPLYYLLKTKLADRQALLGCGVWALSEAAYYRAAYFGSTEALGFLMALAALTLYAYRKPLIAFPLLGAAFYAHLLPAAFISAVIVVHMFLSGTGGFRLLALLAGAGVMGFLWSPLNPHQRLLGSLSPASLAQGAAASYSVGELGFGLAMFAGFAALGIAALWSRVTSKNMLMDVYAAAAAGLFAFSWLVYQPNIFAPPRLTFYFLVPGIFYAAKLGSAKVIALIMALSVVAAGIGTPTMLLTEHTMEAEEYAALDEIAAMNIIGDPGWWLADYPATVNLSIYALDPGLWEKDIKIDAMKNRVGRVHNATASPSFVYPFQYIYLSERMVRGGFFMEQTGGRTAQVVRPVADIWRDDPVNWALVYEGHGVRVYHYRGEIIVPV